MDMKRIICYVIPALLFVACQNYDVFETAPETANFADEQLITITAGFGEEAESRSYLSVPEDSSPAKVLWKAGDTFKMGVKSTISTYTYYKNIQFSTTEEGVTRATFTSSSSASGGPCYSVYPASAAGDVVTINGDPVMTVSIPSEQTAVAGGVENGLIHAAASLWFRIPTVETI